MKFLGYQSLALILFIFFFEYSCQNQKKINTVPNQSRIEQIKQNMPDSLKYLLPKLDSAFKHNPNSKLPSELDYLRKFVPDSLKYLLPILDTVFEDDQRYRETKGISDFNKTRYLDSINLKKVIPIIDRYGILGANEIGIKGRLAVFLVLQHSSLTIHLKYLPQIENAFKQKKITSSEYAMYIDRTYLAQNKMQIYGTQVKIFSKGKAEIQPIFDVDNLDKRRDSIGIGPIEKYLKNWNVRWDIDQYKKDLPELKVKYKIQ